VESVREVGPFRDAVLAILAAIAKQERARRSEPALALRAKGLSLRAIAAETGVSFTTVQRIVQAARKREKGLAGLAEAILPGRRARPDTRIATFMFRKHLSKGFDQVRTRSG
jgi:transcriptional regulator with XRE-family HTH domain